MAIYAKPVWALMKDMATVLAPTPEAIFSKQQAIDWFSKNYPKIKTGTITAHLIRLSTNAPTRTHYNAKPGQDDVFFQLDGSHFRLYQPTQDPSPIYTARETTDRAQDSQEEYQEETAEARGSEACVGL